MENISVSLHCCSLVVSVETWEAYIEDKRATSLNEKRAMLEKRHSRNTTLYMWGRREMQEIILGHKIIFR
jgi:hypothetical protein